METATSDQSFLNGEGTMGKVFFWVEDPTIKSPVLSRRVNSECGWDVSSLDSSSHFSKYFPFYCYLQTSILRPLLLFSLTTFSFPLCHWVLSLVPSVISIVNLVTLKIWLFFFFIGTDLGHYLGRQDDNSEYGLIYLRGWELKFKELFCSEFVTLKHKQHHLITPSGRWKGALPLLLRCSALLSFPPDQSSSGMMTNSNWKQFLVFCRSNWYEECLISSGSWSGRI